MSGEIKRTNNHVYGERALWLKEKEVVLAKTKRLNVIIRQGDRSDQALAPKQWLPLLEPIPLYYILVPGDQARGIAAQFEKDDGATVKIVGRNVTQIAYVKTEDLRFGGGYAVPNQGCVGVLRYLEEELAPGKKFSPSDLVTVYSVLYELNGTPASD